MTSVHQGVRTASKGPRAYEQGQYSDTEKPLQKAVREAEAHKMEVRAEAIREKEALGLRTKETAGK